MQLSIPWITDIDLKGRQVAIRCDFNVPMKDGKVLSDARIVAALPTLRYALSCGARIMVVSHWGRPQKRDPQCSLFPVVHLLEQYLGVPVHFYQDWLEKEPTFKTGEIALCENIRFYEGEMKNSDMIARKMAAMADVWVMDAFSVAHRQHASTCGVIHYAARACGGLLFRQEIDALERVMSDTQKCRIAVVGGAKIASKLPALEGLIDTVDSLILGGGIANTCLASMGYSIGKSLYEPEKQNEASRFLKKAHARGVEVILPKQVLVVEDLSRPNQACYKTLEDLSSLDRIVDYGSSEFPDLTQRLYDARTILWNGPLGLFEVEQFSKGTGCVAQAIAESSAYSYVGGGDTLAAIEKWGIEKSISYRSMAGGAFLSYWSNPLLPTIKSLQSVK